MASSDTTIIEINEGTIYKTSADNSVVDNVLIRGTNTDDTIINDNSTRHISIKGGNGNDYISNNGMLSVLYGESGNDTLVDTSYDLNGVGSTLVGGNGDDVFVYGKSDAALVIEDYSQGDDEDILHVSVGSISDIEDSGNDKIITIGNGKVTLKGSAKAVLHLRNSTGDTVQSARTSRLITGTDLADSIVSSGTGATINALGGNNTITSSGSGSSIKSGTGVDHINITTANVTVSPGAGNDQVTLGSSNVYQYTSGEDVIFNFQNSSTIDLSSNTDFYNALDKTKISVSGEDVTFTVNTNSITFKNALSKTINFKNGSGIKGFVVDGSADTDITVITHINSPKSSASGTADNDFVIINADEVTLDPAGGDDTITFNHTDDDKGSVLNHTAGSELVKGFNSDDKLVLPGADHTLGAKVSGNDIIVLTGAALNPITLSSVRNETVRAFRANDQVLTAYNGVVTLTGTSGEDTFYYASGSGNQVIKDYGDVNGNVDEIVVSTDVQVSAAAVKNSDVVLTIGSNTLTIANVKGKEIDIKGYGPQEYGVDKIEINNTNNKYDTVNVALNASVVTVDASARDSSIHLVGNSKNNVIVASKRESTLNGGAGNDTLTGSNYSDKFIYTGGKDLITNFVGWAKWDTVTPSSGVSTIDALIVGGGISTGTAYSVSGSDVIFNIDKDNTLTVKNARNKHIRLVSDTDVTKILSDKVYRAETDLIVTNEDVATLYGSYKSTDTSISKIGNVYIPTVSAASDSKVKLIDANLEYDSSVSLFLLGNSLADSIVAHKTNNDTLFGGDGKTADTLYGNEATVSSGGKNYFLYQANAGNDVIVNYHDNEGDVIYFLNTDTTIASSSMSTKTGDVTFTITNQAGKNKSTLKVANGQGKRITFLNPVDSTTGFISQVFGGTDITVGSDDLETVNTKVNTNVKNIKVDSTRTTPVYIVGNSKANSIVAGAAAATLQGGTGNDTLVGSTGTGTNPITFAFNKTDGTGNRIQNFKFGTDSIKVLSGALSASATIKNSSDINFTIGKTKVRVEGARGQKVTFVDTNGLKSTQTYGEKLLTLTNDDVDANATVNTAANSLVVTINAADLSTKTAYIAGNKKANYIMAGKTDETIATAAGKDTVKVSYNQGKSLYITDYVAGTDKIELAAGASIVAASTLASGSKFGANAYDTVSADSVILTIAGGSNNTDTSTLVVQGTIKTSKKGVKSYGKITVIDDNKNITYAQAYGGSSIAVANGDGDTVDARGNNNVVTINAKARSKKAYIIGNNNLANSIYGGKKADTIVASSKGGTIFGAAGADLIIADESTNDVVSLSGGAGNDTLKATFGANTLTGGKGNDVFYFDIKKADSEEAVITDIGVGSNTLYLETGTHLVAAQMSGSSDVVVTLKADTGGFTKTVKLLGANNKKVTVYDASNKTSVKQVLATNTLTVVNADGDTIDASTSYNSNNVEVVNAKKRSKSVMLIANDKGNTLIGGSKADTLQSGGGNDYLTGGKGNDVFMVGLGGNDTISDYSLSKNNTDSIQLAGGVLTSYSVSGKNVTLDLGVGGTVTVLNGKDKKLAFLGADGKSTTTTVAGSDGIFNDYNELVLKKANSQASAIKGQGSLDSRVKLIDASANTQATTILANDIDSTIKGSKYADSIQGGSKNDLITTGKGKDTLVMSLGNDTVTDYVAGTDMIALPTGVSLKSAEHVNGTNLKLTATDGGTLLILNAVKKGKDQKITVLEGNTVTSQVYDRNTITLAASDGSVVDLRREVNKTVTTVDGSKLSAKAPITIYAGTQGGTFTGGKGNDTFDLSVSGRTNQVKIVTSAGTDKVTGFKSTDAINLGTGHKINSAKASSSATEYTLEIKNSKNKVVGTLDITGEAGAFKTSSSTEVTKTTVDKKTKATTTIITTSFYVEVGGQKGVYSTSTSSTVTPATTTKSYEERIESELFEDNNFTAADDLSNITNTDLTATSADSLHLTDSLTDSFKPSTAALTTNKRQNE